MTQYLFSLDLSYDADWEAVEAQLLEMAAIPGVTVVLYDGAIVGPSVDEDVAE